MATSKTNPFDVTALSEVRPQYVGAPVEELEAQRVHLSNTMADNQTATGMLNTMYANLSTEVQEDEVAVGRLNEFKNKFNTDLDGIRASRNMAYAGNIISDNSNRLVGDTVLANRKKLVATHRGQLDGVRNNPNLSPTVKKLFVDYADYNKQVEADDERGIYHYNDMTVPYERFDVNKALFDVAKVKLGYPDITSFADVKFLDENGNKSDQYNPNATAFVFSKNNWVNTGVSAEDLQLLFKSTIDNNDAMAGYLIQEGLIKDNLTSTDPNKNSPFEELGAIYNNPTLRSEMIDNASKGLADALTYNQRINDDDIQTASNYQRAGGKGTEPAPYVRSYKPSGNNFTTNSTPEEVQESVNRSNKVLETQFDDNLIEVTEDDRNTLYTSIKNNDSDGIAAIAKAKRWTPAQTSAYIATSRAAMLDLDLADAKVNAAEEEVRFTEFDRNEDGIIQDSEVEDRYPLFNEIPNTAEAKVFNDLGIDYSEYPGANEGDQILALAQDITEQHRALVGALGKSQTTRAGAMNFFGESDIEKATEALSDKYPVEAQDAATALRLEYVKPRAEFEKEYKEALGRQRGSSDAIISTKLLSYNIGHQTAAYNSIAGYLNTPESISDLALHDGNGNPVTQDVRDKLEEAGGFKLLSIAVSPKAVGTADKGSWVIRGELTSEDGKSRTTEEYQAPVGASQEGFDQGELFDTYIKNNPEYIAANLINKVIANNANGTFTIPGSGGMKVKIDNKKGTVSYILSNGQYSEQEDDARRDLANQMQLKNMEFALGNEVLDGLTKSFTDIDYPLYIKNEDDKDEIIGILMNQLNENELLPLDDNQAIQMVNVVYNILRNNAK